MGCLRVLWYLKLALGAVSGRDGGRGGRAPHRTAARPGLRPDAREAAGGPAALSNGGGRAVPQVRVVALLRRPREHLGIVLETIVLENMRES